MKNKKSSASDLPVRRRHWGRLMLALDYGGGWWCLDCDQETERMESDQGQPAHCARCRSHRIEYQPPLT